MDGMNLGQVLVVLAVYASIVVQGYRRRRDHWTRGSWRRFGKSIGASCGLVVVGFVMAFGVDAGVYDHMSDLAHDVYFYTLMACTLGGTLGTAGLTMWFGTGRPDRQFFPRPGDGAPPNTRMDGTSATDG